MRQRRNKTSTAATFATSEPRREDAPKLGEHPRGGKWHKRTRMFWDQVWSSPMSDEYLEADTDGLFQLAALVDDFWWEPSSRLATEIRLQRQCFGLTPIDRRRLQWEIVRAEEAERKKKPKERAKPEGDPREALKLA